MGCSVEMIISLICLVGNAGCSFILLLVGIILLPIASDKMGHVESANPSTDFRFLGDVCNVTGVEHCWTTHERRHNTHGHEQTYYECEDTYKYNFVVTDPSAELLLTYQSRHEGHIRDGEGVCWHEGRGEADWNGCSHDWRTDAGGGRPFDSFVPSGGHRVEGSGYYDGDVLYSCWAPMPGYDRHALPSVYRCGGDGGTPEGDACVKLWGAPRRFRSSNHSRNGRKHTSSNAVFF